VAECFSFIINSFVVVVFVGDFMVVEHRKKEKKKERKKKKMKRKKKEKQNKTKNQKKEQLKLFFLTQNVLFISNF